MKLSQLKEQIRSVIREQFLDEMSKNDVHVKEIMKFYDKGTYSTKKAVSIFVSGKTNATRNQIIDELGDLGYDEIWDVMDHFKLKLESVDEYVDDKGVEHVAAALPQTEEEPVTEALVKGKTYGGSKCEGGCFVGKAGLMKIIKISKDSPKDVFMFRDDNYSGLQPHFIKNGVIAKATVINPAYDLEKHKVRNLKIGNDVILSVRLFVSTNESVTECKTCNSK
jgi:hypothetical protein